MENISARGMVAGMTYTAIECRPSRRVTRTPSLRGRHAAVLDFGSRRDTAMAIQQYERDCCHQPTPLAETVRDMVLSDHMVALRPVFGVSCAKVHST